MEIEQVDHEAFTTLIPKGELDANSSILLDEKIGELIANKQVHIHVVCNELSYISSAGWGVFISYIDELNLHNGKIVLSDMSESVKDVFDLLGLNQLIATAEPDQNIAILFE